MEKLYKSIDGEIFECTQEEILKILADKELSIQKLKEDNQSRLAKIEADKLAKQSALVKLQALGLTEQEIKSLLGI